ncbi:hypothetical protein [Paenibacillus senegalimassiliensis]|uniref:hypothetical protein n=1 Tax=Paenibacillus senegalimassiliensis TaxID=1737426 RepID=UPI00073E5132|nr:hypothetical protein [Paenibacillus senegalimassiliensis]
MPAASSLIRKWSKPFVWSGLATLLLIFSTGCMYRGEQQKAGPVSYAESVGRVQQALDRFQEERGILPIFTAGEEIPRYEKFRLNLGQMKQLGYLDDIPAAAFEQGGSVYFLVINEEVDPTVKVMDLNTVQKVNDVQRQVELYRSQHGGQLPGQVDGEAYPGLYQVDLSLAQASQYELLSVYSSQALPYLVDAAGHVYVDYAYDIMQAIDQSGRLPQGEEDLRQWLTDRSSQVPVKSLPYRWLDGAPLAELTPDQ